MDLAGWKRVFLACGAGLQPGAAFVGRAVPGQAAKRSLTNRTFSQIGLNFSHSARNLPLGEELTAVG